MFLQPLIDSGTSFAEKRADKRSIKLTNNASMGVSFAILSLLIYRSFIGALESWIAATFILESLFSLLPIIMNRLGYIKLSRIYLCWFAAIIVPIDALLYLQHTPVFESSMYAGFRFYLISFSCIPFLVFNLTERKELILALLVPLGCIVFYDSFLHSFGYGYLDVGLQEPNYFFTNVRALISFFCLALAFFFLKRSNERSAAKNDQLLAELTEKNNLILRYTGSQLQKLNDKLNENNRDLGERVKELNCLYKLSELANDPEKSIEKIISEFVEVVPLAYQYPEITCASITLNGVRYESKNFTESTWKQQAEINTVGDLTLKIEVFCNWQKSDDQDSPFLKEERLLINSIAGLLRNTDERKRAIQEIQKSEKKYRHIFENLQDVFFQTSFSGTFMDISPSIKDHLGYTREELINTNASALYHNPEDRQKWFSRLMKFGEINDYEICMKSAKGEMVYASLNARIIMDEAGNPDHLQGAFRNISERKRMEEQLFEHREKLTLFIEHSPAALAMFDNELNYIATSRRWLADNHLAGKDVIGLNHYDVLPVTKKWRDVNERCLRGAVEKCEEDIFVYEDGTKDWIRWEVHPWHKAKGEIGGIIVFSEIITERKKATELFRVMFENSPDIILIVNKDYRIETINRTVTEGATIADFIGGDCISFLPAESQTDAREAIKECFATGKIQEIENHLRSGQWVQSRFVPILTEGTVTQVMIIATDNTQRRQVEFQLRQSEERHRAITENISDSIMLIGGNGELIYQSPSMERTVGYSSEEAKGKKIIDFVHPDDAEKFAGRFAKLAVTPGVQSETQYRIQHKKGHYIWTEGFATNLLHDPHVRAIVSTYRDITVRKEAEEWKEKRSQLLEEEVKSRTHELNKALNKEKELVDLKSKFVSIASHEFRTPLSTISLSTGFIRKYYERITKVELNQKLDNIDKQLNHMVHLLDDVLMVGKADSGKIKAHNSRIGIETFRNIARDTIQGRNSGHKLVFISKCKIDSLITDEKLIRNIITNLVSNAAKFSPGKESIIMKLEEDVNSLYVEIQDFGLGIPESDLKNLYNSFTRGSNVSTIEGTGLGLSIVKKAVEILDGSISVNSQVNVGTTFKFRLPIHNE